MINSAVSSAVNAGVDYVKDNPEVAAKALVNYAKENVDADTTRAVGGAVIESMFD